MLEPGEANLMTDSLTSDSQSPVQIELAPSLLPETRGLVLHLHRKMNPENLESAVERSAQAGFNLLVVRVFSHGVTAYPSDVMVNQHLPRQNRAFRGWDPLARCMDVAQRHGMLVYAVFEALCAADRTGRRPKPILSRYPRWGMRNKAGAFAPVGNMDKSVFLCPFNPAVRRFIGDLVCELAEGYPVSGVVFDLVPFPALEDNPKTAFCFCPSCKSQVASELTIDLETLDFATQSQAVAKWTGWKQQHFATAMAYWRMRIRKVRKDVSLIIQVTNSALLRRSEVKDAWDYVTLLEDGCFEEALAPGYSSDAAHFHAELDRDIADLPENMTLLPLVSAADAHTLCKFVEHIRGVSLPGAVYDLAEPLSQEQSTEIEKRVFDAPAFVPEVSPLSATRTLIGQLIKEIPNNVHLCNFLKDLLKFLNMEGQNLDVGQVQQIMENLHGIESQIRTGKIHIGDVAEPVLRTLSVARRILRLLML